MTFSAFVNKVTMTFESYNFYKFVSSSLQRLAKKILTIQLSCMFVDVYMYWKAK